MHPDNVSFVLSFEMYFEDLHKRKDNIKIFYGVKVVGLFFSITQSSMC